MVMTNKEWWKEAKWIGFVNSQQELNKYHSTLDRYTQFQSISMWNSTRLPIFWTRFYIYMMIFKFHYWIPSNFTFLRPGLEILRAI